MSEKGNNPLIILLRPNFNTKNWGIFAYCLLAATTFWIFNALGNTFETVLSYPINIRHSKDEWIATESLPEEVNVKVSGTGWFLTRYIWNQPKPISIEIDSVNQKLTYNTNQFINEVREELPGLVVNGFVEEEIKVPLELIASKTLIPTLALGAEEYLQKGFRVEGTVEFLPPSLLVSGPLSMVTQLPDTLYIEPEARNINKNHAEKIKLPQLPSKLLSYQTSTLIISFNAIRFDSLSAGDSLYLMDNLSDK